MNIQSLANLLSVNRKKSGLKIDIDKNLSVKEQALEVFKRIYGFDDLKFNVYRMAMSELNGNVLLVGPPATNKSLMMEIIAESFHDVIFFGANTTGAGFVETLYANQSAKFVIVDELDKLSKTDLKAMLGLLNDGHVKKDTKTIHYDFRMNCKVFATANSNKFGAAIKSRFQTYNIPPYSDEDFVNVVKFCLQDYIVPEISATIAQILIQNDRKDVRIAMSLMAQIKGIQDINEIVEVVETYLKYQTADNVDYN
jgi:Holliday junction DNA helicase RuvB